MLDSSIRPLIDPPLNAVARILARKGIAAGHLTALGFALSLGAFAALSFQIYAVAIIFIIASRLMDGLDGPVARQTQATDLGGYLDIVCDFIFYSGCVFFFAVGRPETALAAAFLVFSFMGTGTSFLAYAICAAKRNINHDNQGRKSFFYLSGLTEGTETIAVLLLMCLIPSYFILIACIYGAMCWLTTIFRVARAVHDF